MATVASRKSADLEPDIPQQAAEYNVRSQENLFDEICAAQAESGNSMSVVAERLGITMAEASAVLRGNVDLTLTELRLLLVASEVVVDYQARPARRLVSRWSSQMSRFEHNDHDHDWTPGPLASWIRLAELR